MKFVILAPEAHGHVNPTLPLAAALGLGRALDAATLTPDSVSEAAAAVSQDQVILHHIARTQEDMRGRRRQPPPRWKHTRLPAGYCHL